MHGPLLPPSGQIGKCRLESSMIQRALVTTEAVISVCVCILVCFSSEACHETNCSHVNLPTADKYLYTLVPRFLMQFEGGFNTILL